MRKTLITILSIIMLMVAMPINQAHGLMNTRAAVDTQYVSNGIIVVNYVGTANKKYKLLVEKDGNRYTYDLNANGRSESFSLQMGSGKYSISIMENTEGTKYRTVVRTTVDTVIKDERAVYLNSIQNVEWNESMVAIKKAKELTKDIKNNDEKIKVIYDYVVTNIKYDYNKLESLDSGYIPNIDETFISGQGICYDFSAVFSAMLRSVGIPSKMVMGYTKNAIGYHAWNEVYIEATNQWVVVDSTFDSQMKQANYRSTMTKVAAEYEKVNQY